MIFSERVKGLGLGPKRHRPPKPTTSRCCNERPKSVGFANTFLTLPKLRSIFKDFEKVFMHFPAPKANFSLAPTAKGIRKITKIDSDIS